jgi:hypothetical protein
MDYTVKELYKLTNNTLCERQIRRRCNLLQPTYPEKIKRTSNRKWLVNDEVKDEVIQRKNNRLIDSHLINSGKQILNSEYLTLKETLDEIRQVYDTIEWNYFGGFRPKYNIGGDKLFTLINSLAKELKKRTKSSVTIFYAIEKDDKGIYHVHLALKGIEDLKKYYDNAFTYKFKNLNIKEECIPFKDNLNNECYKYFSKEYFVDKNMRIGILTM